MRIIDMWCRPLTLIVVRVAASAFAASTGATASVALGRLVGFVALLRKIDKVILREVIIV